MPGFSDLPTNNYFAVELGSGPFPDLLTVVSNGIGGSIDISYQVSTHYNNQEVASTRSRQLLPFPEYTVASIAVADGLYPGNTTTYAYSGGKWNVSRREFDGFAQTTEVDPLGMTSIHWFHQAGGRDNSASGEYQDIANSLPESGAWNSGPTPSDPTGNPTGWR